MLDEYLKNARVNRIINNIKNKVHDEKDTDVINYKLFANEEKVLFVFYDALIKYKIIIDDKIYFEDYLEQLDKLLKKINNIDDLTLGINKLICKFTCIKLGIKSIAEDEHRNEILSYLYQKYIVEGYFVHGFSSCYCENIKRYGFMPEAYINFYSDFAKINSILEKYNVTNFLDKDFLKREIYFTDSFVKACNYSANSPGYFYNLLYSREYNYLKLKKDILLKGNFSNALKNVKKILGVLEVDDNDKAYILDIVKKEWNLLFQSDRRIALLLVKRNLFLDKNGININKIINDEEIDLYEAVDKVLSERNVRIPYFQKISVEDLEVVTLEGLVDNSLENTQEINLSKMDLANDFRNVYGNISPLLLIGSILISLGVIISILMLIGG